MVSLTFIVLTWQLLIVLPLVYSAGSLQYVCGPGSGDTVQMEIHKTSNNLTGFVLNVLTPTKCTQPIKDTPLHYVLGGCPKDTDILIEFTKIEKDKVLRRINERMYNLNCHKDDRPVTRIVTATGFGVTRPSSPAHHIHNFQNTKWVPAITMSVSQSSVVIGDTLTVTITSTDGSYKHAAQTCRATSGIESHDLWDYSNCTKGDSELFGNTQWNHNTTSISHTLEAFRFEKSHTIQLECTVMICPTAQESQCTAAYDCKPSHKRRRRREATSRTAVVKTTLNVQDFLQDFPNSGAGSFLATSTLIGTAVTIYRALT